MTLYKTLQLGTSPAIIGDVHSNSNALHYQIAQARKGRRDSVKTVIQVGDFWIYDDPKELRKLSRYLKTCGIEVFVFIRGNHENYAWLGDRVDTPGFHELAEGVYFASDGARGLIGDKTFVVAGGAVSLYRLVEELDFLDKMPFTLNSFEVVAAGGPADVMFTHDLPAPLLEAARDKGILGKTPTDVLLTDLLSDEYSRSLLGEAFSVVNPEYLFHGHFHTGYTMTVGKCLVTGLAADRSALAWSVFPG